MSPPVRVLEAIWQQGDQPLVEEVPPQAVQPRVSEGPVVAGRLNCRAWAQLVRARDWAKPAHAKANAQAASALMVSAARKLAPANVARVQVPLARVNVNWSRAEKLTRASCVPLRMPKRVEQPANAMGKGNADIIPKGRPAVTLHRARVICIEEREAATALECVRLLP